MSVRSLRAAARRSPSLVGALALSASLVLAGCGGDDADGDQEDDQDVEQGVDEDAEDEEDD